jgi:mono/diheme cytochrome c family protein
LKALKGKKGLTVLFTALFLLTISFGLYGCAKKPATAPAPAKAKKTAAVNSAASTSATPAAKATAKAAAGKTSATPAVSGNVKAAALKIIASQGCAGCHVINGKGGSIGPNLDKEGTKGHSIHWLEVQINTPKVHNKTSMMPNHNLNPSQLKTVASYLESQK